MSSRTEHAPLSVSDAARFLRLRSIWHRLRQSLFVVPALMVAGSVVASQVALEIDQRLDDDKLPGFLVTTVDSARSLLSAIAGGTISAAAVVFSLTLVAVQLASSQFSPRTLGTFLGDRFQQVVIGLVLGSFGYSLLVLREVRGPLVEDGGAVVPGFSVSVAVLLAMASLVALIASINHTAQALRVESVVGRITGETIEVVKQRFDAGPRVERAIDEGLEEPVEVSAIHVAAPRSGWVQQIGLRSMIMAVPAGSTLHIGIAVGDHVLAGSPLVHVSPQPSDLDTVRSKLLGAAVVGDRRTLQQDVSFGLVQLEDVALRALSPGVNDPNTAIDVIARIGEVLVEILSMEPPWRAAEIDDRQVFRPAEPSLDDYVAMGLGQIRHFARGQPSVILALVRTITAVDTELRRRRDDGNCAGLRRELGHLRAEVRHLPSGHARSTIRAAIGDLVDDEP